MVSRKLAAVNSREDADRMLAKAREAGGKDAVAKWQAKKRGLQSGVLPASPALQDLAPNNAFGSNNIEFQQAYCFFDAYEAGDALMAMGVDIHAISKDCPRRDENDEAKLVCQVDSAALFEWVGEASTRLSQATSNCATTANIPTQCAGGITGLVSGMGELAASAALLAGTCPGEHQAVFASEKASDMRRLFLASGEGATAVQCAVDVGLIISNIGNMAYFIYNAAESPWCDRQVSFSVANEQTGLASSNCAVDISGAIAFFLQMVSFVENLIVECLNQIIPPLLCSEGVTGVTASAAQLAHFGAATYTTCSHMDLVAEIVTFEGSFLSVVGGKTALFLEQCSHYLAGFQVTCILVRPGSIVVTLSGKPENIRRAKNDLEARGMDLPSFPPLGPATPAAYIAAKQAEVELAAAKADAADYSATAAKKAAQEAQELAKEAQQTASDREAAREAAEDEIKKAKADAAAKKAEALKAAADDAAKKALEAAEAAKAAAARRLLPEEKWAAMLENFKGHVAPADRTELLPLLRPALEAGPEPSKLWSSRHGNCQGKP